MKLLRYRVTNFRSVIDSGWIECKNITAFAGENESGKTTLLMALLKLMDLKRQLGSLSTLKINSFNFAKINIAQDMPIDRKEELAPIINKTVFICAEFEIPRELQHALKSVDQSYEEQETLIISKTYDGTYDIDILSKFDKKHKNKIIDIVVSKIPKFMYYKEVTEIDSHIDLLALALKLSGASEVKQLTMHETMVANLLYCLDIWESNLIKTIKEVYDEISMENKGEINFREIFERIPLFKARVAKGFERLNSEFLKWWGKDDVTIGFEIYAHGVIIKINDRFGNSYALNNRSTGFRRFFALFLSFSIAAKEEYDNTILLFDEAGAALHPLTQKKLALFFDELGKRCQLIYNTHTAYMLAIDSLNRVHVVYKDKDSHSRISESLRINDDRTNEMSLFPVQSAIAQYIAEKAMAGCFPIIVLNKSDEDYLSIIKNILMAKKKLNAIFNILIFAAGEGGIDSVAEAFVFENDRPLILLPSSEEGRKVRERLLNGKYKQCPHKVLEISMFQKGARDFEDIMPLEFVEVSARLYLEKTLGKEFSFDSKRNIIDQAVEHARRKNITLPSDFREAISRRMKINTMQHFGNVKIPAKHIRLWNKIWNKFLSL